eukprot:1279497-Rhodomonas_salina.1
MPARALRFGVELYLDLLFKVVDVLLHPALEGVDRVVLGIPLLVAPHTLAQYRTVRRARVGR